MAALEDSLKYPHQTGDVPRHAVDRIHFARTVLVTSRQHSREEAASLAVRLLDGPVDGDDTPVRSAWERYLRGLDAEEQRHLAEALEER